MEEQQAGSYDPKAHGPITGDEVLPVVKRSRSRKGVEGVGTPTDLAEEWGKDIPGVSALALLAAGAGGLLVGKPYPTKLFGPEDEELPKETEEPLATVSAGMSLQQANRAGGIKGRIIWALLNLGREPLVTRVYQKAQLSFDEDKRDDPKHFSEVCHQLEREQILTLIDPDRMSLNFKNPYGSSYQIQCTVRGCYARATEATSQESAKGNAAQEGYVFHGQQAICRKHTHLRDRIRQHIEGTPETRSQRRRRIEEERKQARKENRPL